MIPRVSVIIPLKEITRYLLEALPYHEVLDGGPYEILVLPDHEASGDIRGVRLIATGPVGPAEKRDVGAKQAGGGILAFIDDDAYPRADWLTNGLRHFDDPRVAAVGGPAVTPATDSLLQRASGAVYTSRLGGGPYAYRYLPIGPVREIDDFPTVNLIVRKVAFEEVGGFDTHFWPGEDTKFCLDLVRKGWKIIYDPDVMVWHHRRASLIGHVKQIWRYAVHRGHFARRFPETSRRISYALPSLLVAFLVAGGFLVDGPLHDLYALGVTAYGGALFLSGAHEGIRHRDVGLGLLVVPGIFLTHVVYGLGFAAGLLKPELRR
ncbi:MAG: glycosyltransferase [Nitrospirae bacterium]|nr:glycosyltransferase [Nitrospirota bacterium]